MSTPDPNAKAAPNLTAEAHKIATDATTAVQDFMHAAVDLPAETVKLGLDAMKVAADTIKGLIPGGKP